MKKLFLLSTLYFLTSCAGYVEKMHRQMMQESPGRRSNIGQDHFKNYRRKNDSNWKNKYSGFSSRGKNYIAPNVKRKYSKMKRRVSSDDLIDKNNSGSLWTNPGQSSFLFSKNNTKRNGDIVILEVYSDLKRDIAAELARAFPTFKKQEKTDSKKDEKEKTEQNETSTKKTSLDPNKVYDRISSIVVEEINTDHLLVRGRKDVLYKTQKRTIEVQALVSRRDISDNDSISSQSILESNVAVLR